MVEKILKNEEAKNNKIEENIYKYNEMKERERA